MKHSLLLYLFVQSSLLIAPPEGDFFQAKDARLKKSLDIHEHQENRLSKFKLALKEAFEARKKIQSCRVKNHLKMQKDCGNNLKAHMFLQEILQSL